MELEAVFVLTYVTYVSRCMYVTGYVCFNFFLNHNDEQKRIITHTKYNYYRFVIGVNDT